MIRLSLQLILVVIWILNNNINANNDTSLIKIPRNDQKFQYINNYTNTTSFLLYFNANISDYVVNLDNITHQYYYFCFQIFSNEYFDGNQTNWSIKDENSTLNCYQNIPNYPFNVTSLKNGDYLIFGSLFSSTHQLNDITHLTSNQLNNIQDINVIKKDVILVHVIELIEFKATYEWSRITDKHAITNGVDSQMDIFSDPPGKQVKIPFEWEIRLFINSNYRLLWLQVSRFTLLHTIIDQISDHTGYPSACIQLNQFNINGTLTQTFDYFDKITNIEHSDWFYHRKQMIISFDNNLFCQPLFCGFGIKTHNNNITNQSNKCDYITDQYWSHFRKRKGKIRINLSKSSTFALSGISNDLQTT